MKVSEHIIVMINIIYACIIGLVQGITEFLPVSSSGHIILVKHALHLNQIPLLFDVLMHIATLLVVLFVFRKNITALIWEAVVDKTPQKRKMLLNILIASIPTGIIGLIIYKFDIIPGYQHLSVFFLINAIILYLSSFSKKGRSITSLHWTEILLIGVAQGIAILPGISRAGITIATMFFLKVQEKDAVEFSFLLFIPAVIGAFLLTIKDGNILFYHALLPSLIAMLTAILAGYVSLRFLIRYIQKFHFFAFYLILLASFLYLVK